MTKPVRKSINDPDFDIGDFVRFVKEKIKTPEDARQLIKSADDRRKKEWAAYQAEIKRIKRRTPPQK